MTEPLNKITMDAAFLSIIFWLFSIFIADPVTKGGLPLITLLCGAGIMTLIAILISRFKQNWLKEFALAFSMIGAMMCTIFFAKFF